MKYQLNSIIDNQDVEGQGSITSYNPATEEEVATVSALDQEGAARAVESASRAYPSWAATPVAERARLIGRWLEIMLDEKDRLAQLISLEGGKPVTEAMLVDVFPALESLAYYSDQLEELLAFRQAAEKTGLSGNDLEDVFYNNSAGLIP